jgi:CHAD domain-containing protein
MHHLTIMPLDPKKLQKPVRQLRKSLKKLSDRPSPEEVHDIRTQCRRLEAITHALMLDRRKDGQRLLSSIASIRKHAGKVRDMDVLTGYVVGLAARHEEECRVQLIEDLGGKRLRFAEKLGETAAASRIKSRRRLKRYGSLIAKKMVSKKHRPAAPPERTVDAMAVALELSSELAHWPPLNANNLHPWRLKAKELRYLLQLAEDADSRFIEALGKAKDSIGEWHDWAELEAIATKVLDHGSQCRMLKEIRSTVQQKLNRALAVGNGLRHAWLGAGKSERRAPQSSAPRQAVLRTTAKLAG